MFGKTFKFTQKFFGTHFTQMHPQTIFHLLSGQGVNKSFSQILKKASNMDLIPMATQNLQLSPLLGESCLVGGKEDLLNQIEKSLLKISLIDIQGILNNPVIGCLGINRLASWSEMEKLISLQRWKTSDKNQKSLIN